jgi:hypothetical protein
VTSEKRAAASYSKPPPERTRANPLQLKVLFRFGIFAGADQAFFITDQTEYGMFTTPPPSPVAGR